MFEKILACYDLSSPSEKALNWALKIGESFHSELQVAHVFSMPDLVTMDSGEFAGRMLIDQTVMLRLF